MKQKTKFYLKIWQEGEFIDFYSINHLLFGGLLFNIFFFFNLNFANSLIISFLIMVAWEIYEHFRKMPETFANRLLDIIVGLVGFLMMDFLLNTFFNYSLLVLLINFFLYIFFETWAFIACRQTKNKFI